MPISQTPTTLWEAFASGEGWGATSIEERPWQNPQVEEFYQGVVAPSFGYEQFKEGSEDYFSSFESTGFEKAEEEFRLATGDIFGDQDPFSWEKISRYSPEEAQKLLEGSLYGATDYIGGDVGAEYGTSLSKAREDYTSSLGGLRESLSYGSMMSDISKQSGTSGLALKTGSGRKLSESILEEAYKSSKSLGSMYTEDIEKSGLTMQRDLDQVLTNYLNAIKQEKSDWYQTILTDVQIATGQGRLEGTAPENWEGQTMQTAWQEGLSYEEQEYAYQQGCSVGQIYIDGECQDYTDYLSGVETEGSGKYVGPPGTETFPDLPPGVDIEPSPGPTPPPWYTTYEPTGG